MINRQHDEDDTKEDDEDDTKEDDEDDGDMSDGHFPQIPPLLYSSTYRMSYIGEVVWFMLLR